MKKENLRIVFMGTPEFAVATLDRILERGYTVVAVVTKPDRPVGRHQDRLQAPAVKVYAQEHHIPVLQPEKMKDPVFLQELASFEADLQVVVAFRMLPEAVWDMPRYGTFNVHAALLPQYRGAAPINWAIINGETETGVTTFFIDKDIDTGRIILQKRLPIGPEDDAETVHNGLMELGAEAAVETLDRMVAGNGRAESIAQETLTAETVLKPAPKLHKETCRISWNKTALAIHNFIRGLSPVPGAWTTLKGKTLKLYESHATGRKTEGIPPGQMKVEGKQLFVACTDEWLEIRELQPEGKRRMTAVDFLNGNREAGHFICE